MSSSFDRLFSPLTVRSLRLKNRCVMGAMHTRLETLDHPHKRLEEFYRARAKGGVALVLTGGVSPTYEGRIEPDAPVLLSMKQIEWHKRICKVVHGYEAKICLQILHAGRYARFSGCIAPSAIQAPISRFRAVEMTTKSIVGTIQAFARTAELAQEAGYDGVEIMGSEGYLINQFTAPATNKRNDRYGGSYENRTRFPLEIIRAVRGQVGNEFLIIYRISAADLVPNGMTGEETTALARQVEAAGADMINTGVGWHESRVPTIAHMVPRAAWAFAIKRVKRAVSVPVIASNRINDPRVAEDLLERGVADLVAMARPLLADPDFVQKAKSGRADLINTCIACNQGCLDEIFSKRTATCLVNPEAGREVEFSWRRARRPKRVAVVGGGPAGLSCAISAARRGHKVTLFEAAGSIGGQLNLARMVPGKGEFNELLRYFDRQLAEKKVIVRCGQRVDATNLQNSEFEEIVIATGVCPRIPRIVGIEDKSVFPYDQVIGREEKIGQSVAIIGSGGIAFDVAECLLYRRQEMNMGIREYLEEFAVDTCLRTPGGVMARNCVKRAERKIYMLQRSDGTMGRSLGKTTGWIKLSKLEESGVEFLSGVTYKYIGDGGIEVERDGRSIRLMVDNVVVCAGQEPLRRIYETLVPFMGARVHVIGGADRAAELNAMRAIDHGARLALRL